MDVAGSGTIAWHQISILAEPNARAKRLAVLKQFRSDFRPQYVLALDVLKAKKTGKPTWYRISIPGRPNGRPVRAGASRDPPGAEAPDRVSRRKASSTGTDASSCAKVAVGKPGAETPLGLFYVTWKFNLDRPRLGDPGRVCLETSAYSKLTDWPGGGIVGMHGTPWPSLLGQAVSHGCIRVHNDNIEFLRNRVPLGTPVKIVR